MFLRMSDALQRNGVDLWLNLPVFYDKIFLEANSEYYSITSKGRKAIHDWCHFVCPNRPDYITNMINEKMTLVERFQPAMVSLDFIRHFVFWELVDLNWSPDNIEDGCYCVICLDAFAKILEKPIPSASPSEFIRTHALKEWGYWKIQRVTNTANLIINMLHVVSPDSKIWIKTVPWKNNDLDGAIINSVGQDILALGKLVDGISPMTFTHMLRQTPEWKEALLSNVKITIGKPVISYLQLEKVYRTEEIPLKQFEDELKAGLEAEQRLCRHFDLLL